MTRLLHLSRFICMVAVPALMFGQIGLDPTDIRKPLADQWPTFNGDYSAKRYSLLKQVNRSNVKNLSLAWVSRFIAGSGPDGNIPSPVGRDATGAYPVIVGGLGAGDLNAGGSQRIGGGILMVNGILYMSSPDNAWAFDARDGTILWQYYWKTRGGTHTGNRGMGMWHNNLYVETHDDYLICLDAHTGKEKWKKEISSFEQQYFSSFSPLVSGNHLLVGTGNDMDAPGFLQSFDPETGNRQWITYTVPMNKGDVGLDTWASLDAARHGGAQA